MKETTHYKKLLEEERDKLAEELADLGVQNPKNPNDWDVKTPEMDIMAADENEMADRAEEMSVDSDVLDELERRHQSVIHALDKIENGAFGACEVCQSAVEEDRLEANPAARTCKAHMGEERKLEEL
jgi:RNA polymerase-binding transcription factor DksA